MRVAFVGGRGYGSHYGGVENAIREISTRLAQNGLSVDVYGQGQDSGYSVREVHAGLHSIGAPRRFSQSGGNALLALVNCLYSIVWRRPQVLLLFASGPSLLTLLARLAGVRVIAALRAIDSRRDKWGWLSANILRAGEFSALHLSNRCTVNSLEMYRHYRGEALGLHYIPNGATAPVMGEDSVLTELGLQPERYLLFAARLDPVKRLHLLLEAYAQIPAEHRMPLVIAGGNCKSPVYREQLDRLSIEGVRFIGHVDPARLDPLMRNCAVFVLPSVLEGMSNSLLSAMISGRSVLCADVEANHDVVLGHRESLFAPDSVAEMTAHLSAYCADPALRARCGAEMRTIAMARYSWDATAAKYEELIGSIAD